MNGGSCFFWRFRPAGGTEPCGEKGVIEIELELGEFSGGGGELAASCGFRAIGQDVRQRVVKHDAFIDIKALDVAMYKSEEQFLMRVKHGFRV